MTRSPAWRFHRQTDRFKRLGDGEPCRDLEFPQITAAPTEKHRYLAARSHACSASKGLPGRRRSRRWRHEPARLSRSRNKTSAFQLFLRKSAFRTNVTILLRDRMPATRAFDFRRCHSRPEAHSRNSFLSRFPPVGATAAASSSNGRPCMQNQMAFIGKLPKLRHSSDENSLTTAS